MKLLVLTLALVLALAAQSSDWSGSWKGANLQLTIQAKGGSAYAGTIALEGQNLPFTAQVNGDKLEGTFTAEGTKFPFTITRGGGNYLSLVSEGTTYLLAPVAGSTPARPRNPLGGGSSGGAAVPPADNPPVASSNSIVGDWQGPQGVVRFSADGTVVIAGQNYRYTVQGSTLTLIAQDGQVPVPFSLNGDTMTMGMGAQSIKLTRLSAGSGGMSPTNNAPSRPAMGVGGNGGVLPELVGKWCYMANVNATNGGARSSSQCFVLNANGTYEFSGLTDSYNPNGGSTSQSYDAGTWTATESTITANSRTRGTSTTYRLEKRNHPKNVNDPMLVLDGQAFVTAWQKPPWR